MCNLGCVSVEDALSAVQENSDWNTITTQFALDNQQDKTKFTSELNSANSLKATYEAFDKTKQKQNIEVTS